MARPMRRLPPVTRATRPAMRKPVAASITGDGTALEVQAGLAFVARGGVGVDVALTEDEVLVAADLDLVSGIGREQDAVALFDVAHGGAHRDDLGPDEAPVHVRGGGDEDAGA